VVRGTISDPSDDVEGGVIERVPLVRGRELFRHTAVRLGLLRPAFEHTDGSQANDANLLCVGSGRWLWDGVDIVDAFLGAAFEGGRHAERVATINSLSCAGQAPWRPVRC
jgi:hypothetical protein